MWKWIALYGVAITVLLAAILRPVLAPRDRALGEANRE